MGADNKVQYIWGQLSPKQPVMMRKRVWLQFEWVEQAQIFPERNWFETYSMSEDADNKNCVVSPSSSSSFVEFSLFFIITRRKKRENAVNTTTTVMKNDCQWWFFSLTQYFIHFSSQKKGFSYRCVWMILSYLYTFNKV